MQVTVKYNFKIFEILYVVGHSVILFSSVLPYLAPCFVGIFIDVNFETVYCLHTEVYCLCILCGMLVAWWRSTCTQITWQGVNTSSKSLLVMTSFILNCDTVTCMFLLHSYCYNFCQCWHWQVKRCAFHVYTVQRKTVRTLL